MSIAIATKIKITPNIRVICIFVPREGIEEAEASPQLYFY